MEDKDKTAETLGKELEQLRRKIAELESGDNDRKVIDDVLSRFCESTYSTIFNAASIQIKSVLQTTAVVAGCPCVHE